MARIGNGPESRIRHARSGALIVCAALAAVGSVNAQSNSANSWGAWLIPPAPAPQAGATELVVPAGLSQPRKLAAANPGGISGTDINLGAAPGSGPPPGLKDVASNLQQADLANRKLPQSLQNFLADPKVSASLKSQVAAPAQALASAIAPAAPTQAAILTSTVSTITAPPVVAPPPPPICGVLCM